MDLAPMLNRFADDARLLAEINSTAERLQSTEHAAERAELFRRWGALRQQLELRKAGIARMQARRRELLAELRGAGGYCERDSVDYGVLSVTSGTILNPRSPLTGEVWAESVLREPVLYFRGLVTAS